MRRSTIGRPMTAAEKKAAQRAELERRGLRQYTVTWPIHRLAELRDLEADELSRHERALVLGEYLEPDRALVLDSVLSERQSQGDA
jgi:hypothetical protein